MPPIKETVAEQFYTQVSESIKLVFDLTSRIDERVKMLVERQNDVEERLDKVLEFQQSVNNRITVLETKDISSVVSDLRHKVTVMETKEKDIVEFKESLDVFRTKLNLLEMKCESLAFKEASHDRRWTTAFDFVFKLAFVIAAGFLLYKLGLQAPPTP